MWYVQGTMRATGRSNLHSLHAYLLQLQMGISDGLGSRKLEVLADTAVTLEQNTEGSIVTEIIKKMLKVVCT